MAQRPKVMGVLIEPSPPTWWKANRHKVLAITGLMLGYLIGTHLHGAPDPQQPHPHPGHTTPAPTTPGTHRTHTPA